MLGGTQHLPSDGLSAAVPIIYSSVLVSLSMRSIHLDTVYSRVFDLNSEIVLCLMVVADLIGARVPCYSGSVRVGLVRAVLSTWCCVGRGSTLGGGAGFDSLVAQYGCFGDHSRGSTLKLC